MDAIPPQDDKRAFPRVKAPVLFRYSAGLGPVVAQDIGGGGLRLHSDEPLEVGRRISLEIYPKSPPAIECHAQVVWTRPLPSGSPARFEVGVRFLDLAPDDMRRLRDYVENAQNDTNAG